MAMHFQPHIQDESILDMHHPSVAVRQSYLHWRQSRLEARLLAERCARRLRVRLGLRCLCSAPAKMSDATSAQRLRGRVVWMVWALMCSC